MSAFGPTPDVPKRWVERQFIANFVEKLGSAAPSKFLGNFFESRFAVRSHFNASQSDLGWVY
jgi:hypothetical protein